MVDITEILVHWHAGRSISEIARSLGVDRNTVRKYTGAAQEAGVQPGEEAISATRWPSWSVSGSRSWSPPANFAGDTLDQVVVAATRGADPVRQTPHLPYSFLRRCGLSLW